MTARQTEILDWLKDDPTRRIVVVWFKGTECYNAPAPVGSGVLCGSDVEELASMGLIIRDGDCYRLPSIDGFEFATTILPGW